jgi:predicted ATPase
MGKSMVLGYFSELVRNVHSYYYSMHLQVTRGSGDSVEKNTPFFMWKAVLVQLLLVDLRIHSHDSLAEQRVKLIKKLPEYCDLELLQYIPLLNHILPLKVSSSSVVQQLSFKERNLRTRDLVKSIIIHASRKRPLLLLLDDFQWADPASMELALDLAKANLDNLVMIIATRPLADPVPDLYANICALPNATATTLKPLMPADCAKLVANRLGVRSLPEEVLTEINKGEGNPFFSEQLVCGLRDAGVIAVVDGECRITGDFSKIELSKSVQGMVTSRMDALPAPEQMVLKVGMCLRTVVARVTWCGSGSGSGIGIGIGIGLLTERLDFGVYC